MPDASGYVERTETLALWKELGSGSDVTGSARCWNRVMVTSMLMLRIQVKGSCLVVGYSVRYGMTDIEADGVGSGQIDLDHHGVALVTSMLTLRIQLKGSCLGVGYSVRYGMTDIEADGVGSGQIDLDHHGVALVTSMLTLRIQLKGSCLGVGYSVRYGMTDIEADGVGSGQIDLDHHGVALVTSMLTLRIQLKGSCLGVGYSVRYGMTDIEADGVGSGQIDLDHHGVALVTSMLTLRIQLKGSCLGVGYSVRYGMTDIEADGVGSGQIDLDHHGVALVTSMLTLRIQLKGSCLGVGYSVRYGMTDIEADGVGSDTLALWKDLGSGSDMTGSARWWIRFMGEGQIDLDHHGVALVTSMLTLRIQLKGSCLGVGYSVRYGMTDIEADGVGSDTLALWKDLGSGSDMTGVQDGGSGLWYGMTDIEADGVGSGQIDLDHHGVALVTSMLTLRIQLKGSCLGVGYSVRLSFMFKIDLHYHGVTLVTSMLMLSVQLKGSCLVVGFSVRYGMTDIEADGVGSDTLALWKDLGSGSDMTGSARWWIRVMGEGQIDLDHHGVALVTSMLTLRIQLKGSCLGVGYSVRYGMTDIEADGVGSDTLALWKDLGSGSDMTGSARWWIRFMVKCEILTKGLGLALVIH
ncbi:Repetin [Manis pentadactyla]|nr:Repetin [Manis pentadactyla]